LVKKIFADFKKSQAAEEARRCG